MIFMMAGLSLAVMAQKDGPKPERPPKPIPPKVEPGKPAPKPPKEDRPNKPAVSYFISVRVEGLEMAE